MSRFLRRAAACAAISVSSARRNSTICSTASSELSSAASMRSARLPVAPVTNTPLPWRASTMPSWRSRDTASRITVRLTPNCSASAVSVGSLSPGCTRPSWISASRRLATVSVKVGGEESLGNDMGRGGRGGRIRAIRLAGGGVRATRNDNRRGARACRARGGSVQGQVEAAWGGLAGSRDARNCRKLWSARLAPACSWRTR